MRPPAARSSARSQRGKIVGNEPLQDISAPPQEAGIKIDDVRQVKVDTGTQGYSVIKFLLVRQVNAENGKLRPNAVPPRHDRILQLVSRHDIAAVWVAFFSRVPAISLLAGGEGWELG